MKQVIRIMLIVYVSNITIISQEKNKESSFNIFSLSHGTVESISAIKIDNDNDYVPDRLNETVTVEGVVYSPHLGEGHLQLFIQDENSGIQLYKAGPITLPTINIGDKIRVTGIVAHYYGTTELIINEISTDITILSNNNDIYSINITIDEYLSDAEKYESNYINIENVFKQTFSADWPIAGTDVNLTIWQGISSELIMRVDKETDVDDNIEPNYPISIKGAATQFTSSIPANDGYQFLLLRYSDIEEVFDDRRYIDVDVFLEGPYNDLIDEMNYSLTSNIPSISPYEEDIRIVTTIPSNVVDWVLVELRDKNIPAQVIDSRSAFLLNTGKVVDLDGISNLQFFVTADDYYIAVKHRNHLSVMSATARAIN